MNQKKVLITLAAAIFAFSCQRDNSQEDASAAVKTEQENWLDADLNAKFANSQQQVSAYLFSSAELKTLVADQNVTFVRFVLGYDENTIQLTISGVDKDRNEFGFVDSKILKDSNLDAQLSVLDNSSVSTQKSSAVLNAHLMDPSVAYDGITSWKNKLKTVSDLDKVTSYEDDRFHYYTLEVEVVKELLEKASNKNIGVFLGLNPEGKVTTYLIGMDKNNRIVSSSLTSKTADAGDVYDGARPSPPY
ncbi:hypothetical protein [Flavobacterium ustbae]|uniref:hypothetical protein n=1 Tax=Flavobacterium ustbae TaxID=2488790 RepID=UPI000F780DB1|nr:hypothetical protein [Flavobacterium ustbae]